MRANGFTLVEVLVALAIASIMGIAVIGIVFRAQATTTTAENSNQAGAMAEEALEQVVAFRNKCDDGWDLLPVPSAYDQIAPDTCTLVPRTDGATVCPASMLNPTDKVKCTDIQNDPNGDPRLKLVTVYVYYPDRGKSQVIKANRLLGRI